MQTESQVAALGHVIQLAVAPVFLLSGVSGLLGVLTNRLSRIIDRARVLEERLVTAVPVGQEQIHGELRLLSHRAPPAAASGRDSGRGSETGSLRSAEMSAAM